ncbi:MAG: S-methyl-5'-thioinosine phosphorylase [Betaproteobacteria bacterium]|jgi:5'-methylthioadenosine phosphorylase|nr:MAG: S-methyl-5'-thioinosine phosphorylase [Betaproteobacteria bacterium]
MIGIIGGSGLTRLSNLQITRREVVRTPYGEPSGALTFGSMNGHEVVFIARHGYGHTIPPHAVNYRANVWAMHAQRVSRLVSVASVGGIRTDFLPGALAVPDQIIDYTYGRMHSFFDSPEQPVTHIDFTQPYCEELRQALIDAAKLEGIPVIAEGVYAAAQGPRLETAAEINRMGRDGADMVGMTGMPEAALAREMGLCYASIAVVANWAAGRAGSAEAVDLDVIRSVLDEAMHKVRALLATLVDNHAD